MYRSYKNFFFKFYDRQLFIYNSSLKYKIPKFSQMLLPDLMKISWRGRHDTQHNDIQHNDTQHNDTLIKTYFLSLGINDIVQK